MDGQVKFPESPGGLRAGIVQVNWQESGVLEWNSGLEESQKESFGVIVGAVVGAVAEWLQKHMTMDTEKQEAHETRVWGDSFHSSTGIPHYSEWLW